MKDFSYEVTERLAIISQSADGKYTLELNRISYNGRPAKLDLRRWSYVAPADCVFLDSKTETELFELDDEEAAELGNVIALNHIV